MCSTPCAEMCDRTNRRQPLEIGFQFPQTWVKPIQFTEPPKGNHFIALGLWSIWRCLLLSVLYSTAMKHYSSVVLALQQIAVCWVVDECCPTCHIHPAMTTKRPEETAFSEIRAARREKIFLVDLVFGCQHTARYCFMFLCVNSTFADNALFTTGMLSPCRQRVKVICQEIAI